MDIERIGEARYHLGEGPLWDPWESALYWVDSMAPAIWRLDPASGELRGWDLPGATVGALGLRNRGGAAARCSPRTTAFTCSTSRPGSAR